MSTSTITKSYGPSAPADLAGFRWAYYCLTFGLLVLIAIRSFVYKDAAWDMMILVIVGGGIVNFAPGRRDVASRNGWQMILVALLGMVMAAAMVILNIAR